MANHLRVQLVKTSRTDLLCIHCGGFGSHFAIVAPAQDAALAQVGVHRKCIPLVKARRSAAVAPPQPADTLPCEPPAHDEAES